MRPLRHLAAATAALLLIVVSLCAVLAPAIAANDPEVRFEKLLNAPPTSMHVIGADGGFRAPYINPWTLVNQLEQRYAADPSDVRLTWFTNGHLVGSADPVRAPLLILGTDSYGRDVFSRLVFGARLSVGLSLLAAVAAILIGAIIGGAAGYAGGTTDAILMRAADFVIVLPAMYVVLALRSALPLVLTPAAVFQILLAIFAVLGAPPVAKGVRAIVRTERQQDYVVAAQSLGAGARRLLFQHLIPATRGFLIVQLTLLVPAFIVAEATLSFVGLGFPDPAASWGTMLHDASNLRALSDFPWLLSPAAVMFSVVLSLNVLLQRDSAEALDRSRIPSI